MKVTDIDVEEEMSVEYTVGISPPRAWPLVGMLALTMSGATVLGAAVVFDNTSIGGAGVRAGCDFARSGGFALLALGGLLMGLARIVVDRRIPHVIQLDASRVLTCGLVPFLALAVTLPGTLGCRAAARLGRIDGIGDALLGGPGLTLAAVGAFGVGFALTAAVRVSLPPELIAEEMARIAAIEAEPLDVVDAALARHDLLD